MAADDDKNEAPDPWADLMGDDFGTTAEPPASELGDTPAEAEPPADDADVTAWLTAQDGDSAEAEAAGTDEAGTADADEAVDAVPPLSVFAPEEAGADQASPSSIEIGTGFSGIDMTAGEGEANAETATDGLGDWDGVDAESPAAGELVEAVAATVAPSARGTAPRAKGGGLGPMVGVVAGGVMAIPITMAILIWGFQRDPFGIAKQVPPSMAFLLPQKFRPGNKKRPPVPVAATAAPSLDDLASSTTPADPPAADAADPTPTPDPEGDKPEVKPDPDPDLPEPPPPAVDPLAVVAEPAPKPAPKPDATEPESEPEAPLFPDPDAPAPPKAALPAGDTAAIAPAAVVPVEPAAPALPPLDLAALDTAVDAAAAALEAAAAEDNLAGNAGKKLLVDWYRAVARAADELVKIQREAADTGRPLEDTPGQISALHDGIAAQELVAAALPRLARSWLAYARRDSDGILLPVTFDSAKKVGPYWRARVRLQDGEHSRELAIITREEPEAVAGDRLLVTGIVLEGDVIWAADVRTPAAEPATVDF